MMCVFVKVMSNPDLGLELCECLMESEIRDSVNATAGTAVAAVGIGVVLTLVLPYTSEDFLALALSLVIGYVALLNLPLRRGEVKGKVRRVSSEVFKELDGGMDNSLEETLNECDSEVMGMIEPLEMVFEADVQQVKDAESNRIELASKLEAFKTRIANVE